MKKVSTICLLVCLVLLAIYGGATYWMGGEAHKQYDQLVERINQTSYLKGSVKSYERGFFSSKALTTFALALPEGGDTIQFSLVNSIYHGPFVFLQNPHLKVGLRPVLAVIQTRLVPEDSSGALKKVLEKVPELGSSEILIVISHDGSGESYLDVPSFQKTFSDDKGGEFKIEWGGLTCNSKYDLQLTQFSGSFSSPSLQVIERDNLLRVKDIRGDFSSRPGIKGMLVGSTAVSVGSIEGAEKNKTAFNLASLGLKAESAVSGETINISLGLSFDKLDADGLGLGPLVIELEMRKLDPEVLSRFQSRIRDLQKKAAEKTEAANDEMDALVTKTILDLLAKSPELEIKQLKMKTDKGDLNGKAKLVFVPGKDMSENIVELLGNIDASAELSVSQALLMFVVENAVRGGSTVDAESAKASANFIVMGLMAAKYIVLEDGLFKSNATYKKGVLTVNGHNIDLSNLP